MRSEHDNYPTPEWVVNLIVPVVNQCRDLPIFDPAAGGGALLKPFKAQGRCVSGMDIRSFPRLVALNIEQGDFLEAPLPTDGLSRIVVMNPPYGGAKNLAQRFLEKTLQWCGPEGSVFALLRLNWIADGGKLHGRHALMRRIGTPDVYVLTKRPSFTGDGKTDASAYAWFVWSAAERKKSGRFTLLDVSPET